MEFVKKIIPIKIKTFIIKIYKNRRLKKKYKILKNKKKLVIIGTPHHKNIGDHAIAVAEVEFLSNRFPNYEIVDVDMEEYFSDINILMKYCNSEDIIILQGGGNLGDEYLYDENIRRDAIKRFKNNKIVLFPQTIYFSDSEKGRLELKKTIDIYTYHKKLFLIAREKTSFIKMKDNFNANNIILTPDIVMYLDKSENEFKRDGALFCLRDDVEKVLLDNEREYLEKVVSQRYSKIEFTDMKSEFLIKKNVRKEIVEEKLNQFKKSEIVITDRLHGMIFATITGTPCIALSNYNYKVKGTYEWIKHLEYIKFTEDINEIPNLINELKLLKGSKYDNSFIQEYYNSIYELISNC